MGTIPVLGFSAYSGAGKTTLIERLIPIFKHRGLRLAVIKHDGHRFEIDQEGKDSWRFAQAGADAVIVSSSEKVAYIQQRALPLEQLVGLVHGVDLILVEGYKAADLPQIGIARKASGKSLPFDIDHYIAIVTDIDMERTSSPPCFGFNEMDALADFILHYTGLL